MGFWTCCGSTQWLYLSANVLAYACHQEQTCAMYLLLWIRAEVDTVLFNKSNDYEIPIDKINGIFLISLFSKTAHIDSQTTPYSKMKLMVVATNRAGWIFFWRFADWISIAIGGQWFLCILTVLSLSRRDGSMVNAIDWLSFAYNHFIFVGHKWQCFVEYFQAKVNKVIDYNKRGASNDLFEAALFSLSLCDGVASLFIRHLQSQPTTNAISVSVVLYLMNFLRI